MFNDETTLEEKPVEQVEEPRAEEPKVEAIKAEELKTKEEPSADEVDTVDALPPKTRRKRKRRTKEEIEAEAAKQEPVKEEPAKEATASVVSPIEAAAKHPTPVMSSPHESVGIKYHRAKLSNSKAGTRFMATRNAFIAGVEVTPGTIFEVVEKPKSKIVVGPRTSSKVTHFVKVRGNGPQAFTLQGNHRALQEI